MKPQDALDRPTPEALDQAFKRRARLTNRDAADGMLARGRPVSYREAGTPAGHVVRLHPDGRLETVKIDVHSATTARRSD